jgi:putative flavoprotein involved in K+ transport
MSAPASAHVIVVGGGQAGLSAGYHLKQAGVESVILDAGQRSGDAWRTRWDSLELFTAARYSTLPGLPFPGDPEHFPGKDEIADYLERYADKLDLPVKRNARVRALARAPERYRLALDTDTLEAAAVIVATGAYQQPYVPPIASGLDASVTQLHSASYRNPEQISEGRVLVVGAANSGAQIAEDLAATHQVHLSQGGKLPHLPRRILGRSLHWYGDHLGLIAAPFNTWRGRTQRGELLVGDSLRRRSKRHRFQLLPRATNTHGRTVSFADGRTLDIDAVIWATGYRPDFTWIQLPVFNEQGTPKHQRGVTTSPGLYFLGMHHQYSRGSSLIHWVYQDAEYIVNQIRTPNATR